MKAWVIGQSAPLSGSNASFGRAIHDGAAAYFKMVNAKGGVAGMPVELVTLDDQNQRKIAGANAKKLLETDGVVALFGFASATLSLDAMPQAEKADVSITQVVPNPSSSLPVVKECAKALQDAGVTETMNSAHLEPGNRS